MELGDQLQRYFGTRDPGAVAPAAIAAGVERMRVDFAMEQERGARFALWTLMLMFDAAPDLGEAFAHEDDREAARNLLDMLAAAPPE